jgi:hypothetical protein
VVAVPVMLVQCLDDHPATDDAVVELLELAGMSPDVGLQGIGAVEIAERDLQDSFHGLVSFVEHLISTGVRRL